MTWQVTPKQRVNNGRAIPTVHRIPMIMTRPQTASIAFVQHLPEALARQVQPVFAPLIAIEPLDVAVEMGGEDSAVFTSSNGVRHGPDGAGRTAYCVGRETTRQAQAAGWQAHFAGPDVSALINRLRGIAPQGHLHHFSGVHVRGDLVGQLQAAGLDISRTAVYDQRLLPLSTEAKLSIASKTPVLVPLFSPRTAAHFAASVPPQTHLHLVAMSPAVAERAEAEGHAVADIAAEPTAQAMVNSLEKRLATIRLG